MSLYGRVKEVENVLEGIDSQLIAVLANSEVVRQFITNLLDIGCLSDTEILNTPKISEDELIQHIHSHYCNEDDFEFIDTAVEVLMIDEKELIEHLKERHD